MSLAHSEFVAAIRDDPVALAELRRLLALEATPEQTQAGEVPRLGRRPTRCGRWRSSSPAASGASGRPSPAASSKAVKRGRGWVIPAAAVERWAASEPRGEHTRPSRPRRRRGVLAEALERSAGSAHPAGTPRPSAERREARAVRAAGGVTQREEPSMSEQNSTDAQERAAAAADYYREQIEKLAALIRWPSEPELCRRRRTPCTASRNACGASRRAPPATTPPSTATPTTTPAWADESLADIIDWAYRQQARLTGGGER